MTGPTRLLVLHRERLVADVFAAALGALAAGLEVRATSDPEVALRQDGRTDVLLADQALVPPGLRWHVHGHADRVPWFIALGSAGRPGAAASLAALRAGAHAWLPPDATPQLLLHVVRVVMDGQLWLPAEHLAPVLRELTSPNAGAHDEAGLTGRERTVLELIASGRSTRAIAGLLLLSPNTVRTHRNRLYGKIDAHSAVEAAAWLRRSAER